MSQRLLSLADVALEDLLPVTPGPHPLVHQALVVCGAVLLATLPVVVWAVFFRKRADRRRRYHHHHHHHDGGGASPIGGNGALNGAPAKPAAAISGQNASNSTAEFPRRTKRRRRRAHRPLNPTLAETGGLPPVRTDRPSEPST